MYKGVSAFLIGMGYGVAWFVAVVNTFVVFNRLSAGQSLDVFLPYMLAGWGIILFVHYRAGWFPFRRLKR